MFLQNLLEPAKDGGFADLNLESKDYALDGDGSFEDMSDEEFEKEMFGQKTYKGNDYRMGGDPDIETFIIREKEKPIIQGCRMRF